MVSDYGHPLPLSGEIPHDLLRQTEAHYVQFNDDYSAKDDIFRALNWHMPLPSEKIQWQVMLSATNKWKQRIFFSDEGTVRSENSTWAFLLYFIYIHCRLDDIPRRLEH